MFQFRHFVLPLFAMKLRDGKIPRDPRDARFVGMSFHFNDQGLVATCSHIVKSLAEDESLVGVEMYGESLTFRLESIVEHPSYDFAVGAVARRDYQALPIHAAPEIHIGTDVVAFGMTSSGLVDGRHTIMPRLFKGHLVRTHPAPSLPGSRSTCEISFPSHNGFSGTPLVLEGRGAVAGMLYGNHESTITLHKLSEFEENGRQFSEEIHRVVELGAAHTCVDIRACLADLGIKRVALDEAA